VGRTPRAARQAHSLSLVRVFFEISFFYTRHPEALLGRETDGAAGPLDCMTDWDAHTYDRLSDPQFAWGVRVLDRLRPISGERILDLGCGSGRLTERLASQIKQGVIVALDLSPTMLAEAQARLSARRPPSRPRRMDDDGVSVHLVRGDGAHLPFADRFDAVFSAATFHWIGDHDMLFASIHRALAPGGRLVAQCGGGPNLSVLLDRAHDLMESPQYSQWFGGWSDPWNFADVPATIERMERAGFTRVHVSLESAPTSMTDAAAYSAFLATVCVRHHVARLPHDERPGFLDALAASAAADDPPFTLDYWRLNVSATKPAGAEQAA
jgi:ubiquinone/menaquinone biosynthesis C-methylase UbiE